MRTMHGRMLPFEIADGAENMALDEALLDAVDAEPEAGAVVRTYGWSEPTLSLGYFQGIATAEADPRWQGAALVRRPSGGGALWHDRELTYAVIVPRSHRLAHRPSDLYRAIHGALADRIGASRRGGTRETEAGRPLLCFEDHDPEDLLIAGRKVLGSAQRRRPGAVLQHGSLLLERSAATPGLPGLRELAGAAAAEADWARLVPEAIAAALDLDLHAGTFTAAERRSAAERAERVYRAPSWTRRR